MYTLLFFAWDNSFAHLVWQTKREDQQVKVRNLQAKAMDLSWSGPERRKKDHLKGRLWLLFRAFLRGGGVDILHPGDPALSGKSEAVDR